MTYDDIDSLIDRLIAMPEEERRYLDPIASALGDYLRRERPPVMALPNRIIALACVDLLREWQMLELGRDGDHALSPEAKE